MGKSSETTTTKRLRLLADQELSLREKLSSAKQRGDEHIIKKINFHLKATQRGMSRLMTPFF